jgi:glycosyltransferase involved in cell wall biosynthesis
VILVDNGSTDNTVPFVAEVWDTLKTPFPLEILLETRPGKIYAQEKGLASVQTRYVLICDDDNSLFPNYIDEGYKLLRGNPQIGALGGSGIPVPEVSLPTWFSTYSYLYACAPQANRTGDVRPIRNVIYGAGMYLNMEAYAKLIQAGFKSFLPSRTGTSLVTGAEDGEICWALRFAGYQIWFSNELKFYHYLPAGRLSEAYLHRLTSTMAVGNVVGKLYPRIDKGELTHPIRLFWLKEAINTLIYIVKLDFLKAADKKLDLKRACNQIRYLLSARSKYDQILVELLRFRNRLHSV